MHLCTQGTWALKHVRHSGTWRKFGYKGTWTLEVLKVLYLPNSSGPYHQIIQLYTETTLALSVNICIHFVFMPQRQMRAIGEGITYHRFTWRQAICHYHFFTIIRKNHTLTANLSASFVSLWRNPSVVFLALKTVFIKLLGNVW